MEDKDTTVCVDGSDANSDAPHENTGRRGALRQLAVGAAASLAAVAGSAALDPTSARADAACDCPTSGNSGYFAIASNGQTTDGYLELTYWDQAQQRTRAVKIEFASGQSPGQVSWGTNLNAFVRCW